MKTAIIGGAGVRTPLLVHGLVSAGLPITTVSLFDPDRQRLAVIGRLVERLSPSISLDIADTPEAAIAGSRIVFTSIRVGGLERRARDEAACLALGVLGQETVGAAGFAMAMRTIPEMVRYARHVAAYAPDAWMVNFTNPVGIITQAVLERTGRPVNIVGICDTPEELFESVAATLDLPRADCAFDYVGLNHLGWLRRVLHQGRDRLQDLWNDPARIARIYRAPLFDPASLAEERLLPTEYVYYYENPDRAVSRLREAGLTRAGSIVALTDALFTDLASPAVDPVAAYRAYLHTRSAGYMQIEAGDTGSSRDERWTDPSGYARIAIEVCRGLLGGAPVTLALDVENHGNLPTLAPHDVVEVPSVVGRFGVLPLHTGGLPEAVAPTVEAVKQYERLTIEAAATGRRGSARAALAANPLIADVGLADRLLDALEVIQ